MLLPTKVKVAVAGLTVAGGAVAAAVLGPAGPAVGQASVPLQLQIQVNSPATLVARGAGVEVSVTTQCSGAEPGTADVEMFLNERVGSDIALGGGSVAITCSGSPQNYLVLVQASPNSKAFKKGSVLVQATIGACTPNLTSCSSQEVEPTIQIDS